MEEKDKSQQGQELLEVDDKEKSIIKPKNNKIHFINGEIQYEEDSTSNTSNLKNFSPLILFLLSSNSFK